MVGKAALVIACYRDNFLNHVLLMHIINAKLVKPISHLSFPSHHSLAANGRSSHQGEHNTMTKLHKTLLLSALVGASSLRPALAQDKPVSIWIEGESSTRTTLSTNSWIKGDNPKLLSGGDAFGAIDKRSGLASPAFILWKFDVTTPGKYLTYMRHGYIGNMGGMKYRFVKLGADGKPENKLGPDDGWLEFDQDASVMDRQAVGQWRTVEWTRQEGMALDKGSYLLDLRVTGPNPTQTAADPDLGTMIDVICLTQTPFTPSGLKKPGEAGGGAGGATGGGAGGADPY